MAEANAKWEAQFQKEVKGVTADKAWPLFEDFCSIHKLFPDHVIECRAVEGDYGLIRHCVLTAAMLPPSAVPQPDAVYYTKELLLNCDPIGRCLSYRVVENNVGINDYVATVKVHPLTGGDGCCIRWSVVADPMDGRTFDEFKSGWSLLLEVMVQNIVALLSTGTA